MANHTQGQGQFIQYREALTFLHMQDNDNWIIQSEQKRAVNFAEYESQITEKLTVNNIKELDAEVGEPEGNETRASKVDVNTISPSKARTKVTNIGSRVSKIHSQTPTHYKT